MKRSVLLRILSAALCFMLLLSSVPAFAEATATIIGNGKVNLRKSASMSSKVLGAYPQGTQVTVLSEGSTWSKVSVDGITGYMMSRYLSSTKHNKVMYVRTYSGVKLRLREKPDVFSDVLDTFKPGTAVSVLERGKSWTKVSINGQIGYMGSQYLSETKP